MRLSLFVTASNKHSAAIALMFGFGRGRALKTARRQLQRGLGRAYCDRALKALQSPRTYAGRLSASIWISVGVNRRRWPATTLAIIVLDVAPDTCLTIFSSMMALAHD